MARTPGSEERLGGGANALRRREPRRGGRRAVAQLGRHGRLAAAHRAAHAPRAAATRPGPSQDEGMTHFIIQSSSPVLIETIFKL